MLFDEHFEQENHGNVALIARFHGVINILHLFRSKSLVISFFFFEKKLSRSVIPLPNQIQLNKNILIRFNSVRTYFLFGSGCRSGNPMLQSIWNQADWVLGPTLHHEYLHPWAVMWGGTTRKRSYNQESCLRVFICIYCVRLWTTKKESQLIINTIITFGSYL